MKSIILLPFLAIFGCNLFTEEIEVEKIIRDTVTVEKYIDRYFSGIDTVEIISEVLRVDTVTITNTDTVFITTVVYDTIYVIDSVFVVEYVDRIERIHVYHDTLYIPLGWSTTHIGPHEASVSEFYTLAVQYGWDFYGGDILIEPWLASEFPPASRSSYSTQYFDQFILKLIDRITPDEAYSAIMRELAHWQLNKPYSYNTNDIMSPDFDWTRLKLSDSDAKKKPFLDRLFSKEPI